MRPGIMSLGYSYGPPSSVMGREQQTYMRGGFVRATAKMSGLSCDVAPSTNLHPVLTVNRGSGICFSEPKDPSGKRMFVRSYKLRTTYSFSDGFSNAVTEPVEGHSTAWSRNRAFFYRVKPSLEVSFGGKYVAVRENRVLGAGIDELTLVETIIKKFGDIDFFVGKVGPVEEVEFSSPEFEDELR